MANDRIWIRCKHCGEGFQITKYYPNTDLAELRHPGKVEDWIKAHLAERQNDSWRMGHDLAGEPGFEFVTDDPGTATGQLYIANKPLWRHSFAEEPPPKPPGPRPSYGVDQEEITVYKTILLSILKPVTGISPDELKRKATQLKQIDGEMWAVGEMLDRAARFIEMSLQLVNE